MKILMRHSTLLPLCLLVCFASLSLFAAAQNSTRPLSEQETSETLKRPDPEASRQIDTFRIRVHRLDPILGTVHEVDFDTASLDFQNNTFPERNQTLSASHLGNLGSPFQSRIFQDRTHKTPLLFMQAWEHWIEATSEFNFINTTKPYTNLRYLTTFGNDKTQEENFRFYFTGNVNKRLNIGADYEILYSRGYYQRNSTRDKLANLFGNYQSPRYEAYWKASYNYLENFENGGITDDRYITDPLTMSGGQREYESINIPVHLSDASNLLKRHHLFFNHKYHLGFERANPTDSLLTDFIPVTSLIHTFSLEQNQKRYQSDGVHANYYDSLAYFSSDFTNDTAAVLNINNTFGISLREGFHPWAQMGLTAFIQHEFYRYTRLDVNTLPSDSLNPYSALVRHNLNHLWVGGTAVRKQGKRLQYEALARFNIMGDDMGDFELSGNLHTNWQLGRFPVRIDAHARIESKHPDYFQDVYHSNHFVWNNHFRTQQRSLLGGSLELPALGMQFSAEVENRTNYIYFNRQALPDQYEGNIQVLAATWKQHVKLGVLNWQHHVTYQASSQPDVLALPDLTARGDLFLQGLVSGVLTTRIGVDCQYFTAYNAPAWMPATGVFYNQQALKIGNYPLVNVYGNFHLKTMRFFVMYSHASRWFATPTYFSAPHHPINPTVIKAGLSWNFYD